jgi:hypothetical protein
VTLENNHRLTGLHKQRFILFQILERLEDRVEGLPGARGFPTPAIDDELFWFLGNFRVEIVLDHAIGGFTEPVLAGETSSPRGANGSGSSHDAVSLYRNPQIVGHDSLLTRANYPAFGWHGACGNKNPARLPPEFFLITSCLRNKITFEAPAM